jgi:Ca2+-binding RTX toxin-like protein
MAASAYLNQVQQLYIAYFGRPADPVGQRYWAQVIDDAGGNIASVLAGFSASTESQTLFGTSNTAQKVAAIYSNVFNRAPEAAGLAYWVSQIDSGKVTQAQAAYAIQQAAGAGDASTVNNKLIAANVFTANLDTTAEIAGYSGSTSAAVARAFLNKVDANYASIANVNTYAVTDVALATGTGTVVVTPPPVVAASTLIATLTAGAVSFSGAATGDISVAWDGVVGASHATFARAGNFSDPITFGGGGGASSITLGAADNLIGSASTLAGLTTTGAGAVKLTDTSLNLAGKVFAANSTNDVLTLTTSATTATSLTGLTGFETVHLAGSSAVITIANGANTSVDSTAAVSVQLGTGGQKFVGSTGADTISGSTGIDTLTGGAGIDTFTFNAGNRSTLASTDTITDYRAAGAFADIITISDITTVASNINTVQNLTAQASLAAALNVFANAATTNNGLGVFIWGGNTYAYIETTGATITYVAGDTVIKLGGTPFTAGTSIVGLGIDGV